MWRCNHSNSWKSSTVEHLESLCTHYNRKLKRGAGTTLDRVLAMTHPERRRDDHVLNSLALGCGRALNVSIDQRAVLACVPRAPAIAQLSRTCSDGVVISATIGL